MDVKYYVEVKVISEEPNGEFIVNYSPLARGDYLIKPEFLKTSKDIVNEDEEYKHIKNSYNEFENGINNMFSSIWDCKLDHPLFEDTVGELMSAVLQLYKNTIGVKSQ